MPDINLPDLVAKIRINDNDLTDAGKRASSFGPNLKTAVVAGALAAGAAVVGFGVSSVKAFAEAEQSQLKLQAAFSKFPALAGASLAPLQKLNTALAAKTRFDDDATAAAQANLAQFGLTAAQLRTLTPLVQDFAARTGQDLPSAADAVGKALLGQGRALKQVGIDFQDTGNFGKNLTQVTEGLRAQVGGFAEKEGKTAAGQAAILSNQFGEIKERVGGALTPVLQQLAEVLLGVVNFFVNLEGTGLKVAQVLGAIAGVLVTVIAVTKIFTAVQTALNVVLSLNPIGIIVLAVVALVAGLVLAYKKSETFRDVVKGAFEVVKKAVQTVVDVFDAVWEAIKKVIEWVGKLIDKFKNIKLPGFLTPGSPSPFENSLANTIKLLKGVGNVMPDAFSVNGGALATAGGSPSGAISIVQNFNGGPPNAQVLAAANSDLLSNLKMALAAH